MPRKPKTPKQVETFTHDEATRPNIPTAELQSLHQRMEEQAPTPPVRYPRARPLAEGERRERNEDLDPQIIWKGATLRLTKEQLEQLNKTGSLEIGDAELVWRGKDEQDWSDLVVPTPPIYVQEKIHPKYIIEALKRYSDERREDDVPDLFADFNGLDDLEKKTEFYQHEQHWTNRMILGDSLQVMASLAERENLRGKVQCIYFDPPYGIKFKSNWQVSTRDRGMSDQDKLENLTREPEQVQAFRDTWKDGIHSYLTYLRDRLTVMRDLLTESGSIFVQIGDENVHRVRALMDEVFGEDNFGNLIAIKKTGSTPITESAFDYLLWYFRERRMAKIRKIFKDRKSVDVDPKFNTLLDSANYPYRATQLNKETLRVLLESGADWARVNYPIVSQDFDPIGSQDYPFQGGFRKCGENRHWTFEFPKGLDRLKKSSRLYYGGGKSVAGIVKHRDRPSVAISNLWDDLKGEESPVYVVQTSWKVVQRCILIATDPGDLVLDPTCGSGTTAYMAEQWGRRWITIDTSRVALALARARLMGARYPYYLLADSPEGRAKEQEITGKIQPDTPTRGDIRQGFVYERVPHITLKSIANNAEIDVIWEKYEEQLKPLREELTKAIAAIDPDWLQNWRAQQNYDVEVPPEIQEWEVPRQPGFPWPEKAAKALEKLHAADTERKKRTQLKTINTVLGRDYTLDNVPEQPFDLWDDEQAIRLHKRFWELRIARQKEIDESIARNADVEYLYDRPYEDKSRVRVAGPFTVESLSPHRYITPDETPPGEQVAASRRQIGQPGQDFTSMVLDHLKSTGIHQSKKDDRITFDSITGWPGEYIAAEGLMREGEAERRAAIFIGPEFGTVSRADLIAAAREAADARFDVLIACGFNFDAHTTELEKLGPLRILKAKMNPELHMGGELKATKSGNLFVIFGEPDVEWHFDDNGDIVVRVLGVDVFDPKTGEVRSSGTEDIAAWFIDTDYDEESFFVRHAYFLGSHDPYKSLKTALKAEIDQEAWQTLYSDTSRPFPRPKTGRFAVKVINHFGDEVMKIFEV